MEKWEELIQAKCIQKGWTLTLAESCTGGALAQRLTRLPGCSAYFLGSIVSYSNELKIKCLGVNAESLIKQGAVSEEVVKQMAKGVLKLSQSDFSLAVSGIAGPSGGTLLKPVGTIWAAIGDQESIEAWMFHLSGQREEIIQQTVEEILKKFWMKIQSL